MRVEGVGGCTKTGTGATSGSSSRETLRKKRLTDGVQRKMWGWMKKMRRWTSVWPHPCEEPGVHCREGSEEPGNERLACQSPLRFLWQVHFWTAAVSDWAHRWICPCSAAVPEKAVSHQAPVAAETALMVGPGGIPRRRSKTQHSGIKSLVFRSSKNISTLLDGTKCPKGDAEKWNGRSKDSPPGKFSKWPTVLLQSRTVLLSRWQTSVPKCSLEFWNVPGLLMLREVFKQQVFWLTADRKWCVIRSTMDRVSPKRRNCLMMRSSSSGVTIVQQSNTFPTGDWREQGLITPVNAG